MTLSLAAILSESARRHPERPAVIFEGRPLSYAQLWEDVCRYAGALSAAGVRPGDRVAMLLPNVPDFVRCYYAIAALGAAIVPVHALLTPEEVAFVLRDCQAAALVASHALPAGAAGAGLAHVPVLHVDGDSPALQGGEPLTGIAATHAGDDAVIIYTSGTTGKPKGAVLTHGNLVWNATLVAFELMQASERDVVLGCLPLFHCFGQTCVMNAALRAGAAIALMPRFDPDAALATIAAQGATIFAGVPTMYIGLLEAMRLRPHTTHLRMALSGGASLPLAVLEQFESAFGVPVYEGYGLSETSPVASFNQECFGRKPGTVGCGIWGVELAIAAPEVEERIQLLPDGELGEIVIRGHAVFKGYLGDARATREAIVDGWFRSGDLGTRDGRGFITIVDRKKDLIIRGGFNVYPREVEEVLMRHPAIAQVAVIGVPHPTHGEEIVAVVVPAGERAVDAEALIAWTQDRLGRHKYPRRIECVQSFPLGPSGKVLKRELRERFADSAVRPG
jgi:long-chain acyl-CoA synthetase